jgi:hypothetical protein
VNQRAWLELLLVILPAVLTPLLAWVLAQRGVARRTSQIEQLLKRTELVERLRALPTGAAPGRRDDVLDAEVRDIVADLAALTEPEQAVAAGPVRRRSRLSRFLLFYEQPSWKAYIYRAVFYLFSLFGLVGGLGAALSGMRTDWYFGLLGGGFYIGVGFLFRQATVREFRRGLTKASARQAGVCVQPER